MTPPLPRTDLERFRAFVLRRFGLSFDEGSLDLLEEALRQRLSATSSPRAEDYLTTLEGPLAPRDELRALAERLTVTETYFFRNPAHFRALVKTVLPDRIRARSRDRRLRLLSAGCASGEEPYSLAIVLEESFPELTTWDVQILGLDVNPAMLEKARAARYSAWSLRQMTDGVRERYFRPAGREHVLDERVRRAVALEERNLLDDEPSLWAEGDLDVVFCRNVLMYFRPEVAEAVVARFAGALAPGGYLFLGHAETLRGLSHAFHLRHTQDTFYYQRRADDAQLPGESDHDDARSGPITAAALPTFDVSTSWIDVIRTSSDRIAALSGRIPAPDSSVVRRTSSVLDRAMELLREERFAEGLDSLYGLPPEASIDPDVQLLRAVLLTNCGQPLEARRVLAKLLANDDLNAGAHYLMALCHEHEGDLGGAIEHDRMATYLDPGFAMPRLHHGVLARRGGDLETARRELTQALVLFAREDAARILLFGGGFSREVLLELCHAQIIACGGSP